MKKITGYKTKDGQIFEHEIEAKIREKELEIRDKITEFADNHYFPNMTRGDLKDLLIEFYNQME